MAWIHQCRYIQYISMSECLAAVNVQTPSSERCCSTWQLHENIYKIKVFYSELDGQQEINTTSSFCDELLQLTDEQAADRCLRHEARAVDIYPCVIVMYSSAFCCFKVKYAILNITHTPNDCHIRILLTKESSFHACFQLVGPMFHEHVHGRTGTTCM